MICYTIFAVLLPVTAEQSGSSCLSIDRGGWELVRYMPRGNTFHSATDNLVGTDVYGDPSDMSEPWSVMFATRNFNQFLFAFGNCEKWLIADADVVLDDFWGSAQREIYKSSLHDYSYTAEWLKRSHCCPEDPWISLYDVFAAIPNKDVLYGEKSYVFKFGEDPYHNGASVYIRLANSNLISYFHRSDKDEDGCLNFEEIAFDTADTDKDGELTSSEYISAITDGTLEDTSIEKDGMIIFNRIDRNMDGVLTYDELVFDNADNNKDGLISVEEFFGPR